MNPQAWIKQTDYPKWTFDPAFEAFRAQRAALLEVLQSLPQDARDRTATATGMIGEVYERSASYYAAWMARHERGHVNHIARILRKSAPSRLDLGLGRLPDWNGEQTFDGRPLWM